MLVLTRSPHQKIVLTLPDGQKATIALLSVGKNQARLGITAPAEVTVTRAQDYCDDCGRLCCLEGTTCWRCLEVA